MTHYDAKKVAPAQDGWATILADKRETVLKSGIILAQETGVEKVTELAGEIVRISDGPKSKSYREHAELKEGCRVLFRGFLKYANPIPTEETWEDGSKKEYFFINCADILGIVAPGVSAGVFSGSRAAPHTTAPLTQGPVLPADFKE